MKLNEKQKKELHKNHCPVCNKEIQAGRRYCSNECQLEAQYLRKVENWKAGLDRGYTGTGIKNYIRRYMLEKNNYACEICGWDAVNPVTGKSPLNIHHIDGDYTNNKEENLQVLCPNCHSLTENYGALNTEGSKRNRKQYRNRKDVGKKTCPICGELMDKDSTVCKKCNIIRALNDNSNKKIIWPDEMELAALVSKFSLTSLGKKFGVSDSAIRKHCKKRNIVIPAGRKVSIA